MSPKTKDSDALKEQKTILKLQKELEGIRHSNKMEEITEEAKAKKDVERLKNENQMSLHRLRRRDAMNQIEARRMSRDKYWEKK